MTDEELQAILTPRELEAWRVRRFLERIEGREVGARRVALTLQISRERARELLRNADRKIAQATTR